MGERLDNATTLYLKGPRDGNDVEAVNPSRRERYDVRDGQADLLRVAAGLIVEHWYAADAIGPPEEWVNSGTL